MTDELRTNDRTDVVAPAGRARRTVATVLAAVLALGAATFAVAAVPRAAGAAEPAVNVAAIGAPEASYTASWHNLLAVNDGVVAPTGGYDQAWSTWSGDRPASLWLEYAWPADVTIDRSVLSFWTDGTGANGDNVRVPASWKIQYWDDATEAFVDLPGASGYGSERLTPNTTTFTAVTTDRVRATFAALQGTTTPTYSAVGVTEWELWGTGGVDTPDPVDPNAPIEVRPVEIPTAVGELPALPGTVDAVYEDGRVRTLPVTWDAVTADDVAEAGRFTVAGTAEGLSEPVEAVVHVRAGEPGEVVDVDYVSVVTLAGVEPVLPPTVVAEFEDGSRDSRVGVEWDDVDPADYAEPDGLFFVEGDVDGTDLTAEATVWVVAPDDGTDTTPPTVTVVASPVAATSGWFVEPVQVGVEVVDNRDPDATVEVSVDGGAWHAYEGPFPLGEDGERTVAARATDASGNVGEGSRELRVDTAAPVTVATVEDLGSSVEVTLTASDAGSGVDRIQWEGPGTFWGTYQGSFVRALTDEPQVIEFAATDVAGNVETRGSVVLPALDDVADLDVELTAAARCVGSNAYVALKATNGEDVTVSMTLQTPFGSKTGNVAAGKALSQTFNVRASSVGAGTATVVATATVDGHEVTTTVEAPYTALSCG